MADCIYTVATSSAVSLTANNEKAVIGIRSADEYGLKLRKWRIGLTGTSGAPGTVTVYRCSFSSNPPGTSSTSVTPEQVSGLEITPTFTAAQNWTSMPGALSRIETFPLTPNGGLLFYDLPLGDEPGCGPSAGFVLTVNSPVAVSALATLWVSRI